MEAPGIHVRDMRPDEYEAYTAERERDTAESLSASMPYEQGLAEARHGIARILPDGLATAGHRLLVAENADGEVVGHAWLGLADPRTGSPESAWLYDIRERLVLVFVPAPIRGQMQLRVSGRWRR